MSRVDNCGQDTVSWNVGGHEVNGNVCVWDDAITLDFAASGSTAFSYDVGDTAFRIDPSISGDPFSLVTREAKSLLPTGMSSMVPSSRDFLPRELEDKLVIEVTDVAGFGVSFDYDASLTEEVQFARPTIPMPEQFRDGLLDEIPNTVTLSISIEPGSYLDRVLFGNKTMQIEIPTQSFFEFADTPSCSTQHSSLFSAGGDLASDGESFADSIESISVPSETGINSPSDVRSNLRDRVAEFGSTRNLRDVLEGDETILERIRDGRSTDFSSVDEAADEVDRLRSDLESLVDELESLRRSNSPGAIRDAISTVRSRRGDVGSFCRGEWEEIASGFDIDRIETALDGFSRLRDEIDRLQFMVDTVPGDIQAPETDDDEQLVRDAVEETREQLEAIPDEIFDRIEDLRERVEEKANTSFMDREVEALQNLRSDVSDLIDDIEEFESGRPGRGEALGEARSLSGRLDRIRAARTDAVPCQNRFPDAHELVREFEQEVEQITTDVTEERLSEIEELEEVAISVVEGVEDQQCRENFTRRIARSNRRIDTRVSPVRAAQEFIDQSRERRERLLENLGSSLNESL